MDTARGKGVKEEQAMLDPQEQQHTKPCRGGRSIGLGFDVVNDIRIKGNLALPQSNFTYYLGRKWTSDEQHHSVSAGSFFVIDDAGPFLTRRQLQKTRRFSLGSSKAIVTGSPTEEVNLLHPFVSQLAMQRYLL